MDKPSAQTQVHFSTSYSRVIKDIEQLDQFYDARVLAIFSTTKSEKPTVSFGPVLTIPQQVKKPDTPMYGYPDEESSDGSWYPGKDYRPDTPEPKTPQQAKARLREIWVEPKM